MICLKNKVIGFGIFLPVLLSVLFVSPSYAISDYTVTVDFQTTLPLTVCHNGSSTLPHCSDYSYMIFSPSSPQSSYQQFSFDYNYGSGIINTVFRFPRYADSYYSLSSVISVSLTNSFTSSTITLTDSLPSSSEPCPEPEEPEPCPTCPVVPENPYDNKLDNITKAIYVCAGTLLVLYFFYTIYRMIIKNSGVK